MKNLRMKIFEDFVNFYLALKMKILVFHWHLLKILQKFITNKEKITEPRKFNPRKILVYTVLH